MSLFELGDSFDDSTILSVRVASVYDDNDSVVIMIEDSDGDVSQHIFLSKEDLLNLVNNHLLPMTWGMV